MEFIEWQFFASILIGTFIQTVDQRGAMTDFFVSQTGVLLMDTPDIRDRFRYNRWCFAYGREYSFRGRTTSVAVFQATALTVDRFSITALYWRNGEFNPAIAFAHTGIVTMIRAAKAIASTQKIGAGAALRGAHCDGQYKPLRCVDFWLTGDSDAYD